MRILRFDSVGGASGDMILAALLDLGVERKALLAKLNTLKIGKFSVETRRVTEDGLTGTRVNVKASRSSSRRGLKAICASIRRSKLPDAVKASSIAVFRRIAEVEAGIHRTTPDKIHFHEVGAVDSMVDIVGSCAALQMLGVDEVTVGPLPLGCGTIKCAHGILPNPAPATVELLMDHPVILTDEPFELVTPTGAALLTSWMSGGRGRRTEDGGQKTENMAVIRQSNGFGHRKLNNRPNLLRAILLETTEAGNTAGDSCSVLECNIDDMNPEIIGALFEKLLAGGALDVFTAPIQMKKQRPGIMLTVLCHPERTDSLVDLIFAETTTFGIRQYPTKRALLQRQHVEVQTPYGKVRVKIGSWKGKDITFSPENSDCVRIARARNMPVRKIYEAAQAASLSRRKRS